MAKIFIPKLGTKIRLDEDWSFKLHHEYRNSSLWDLAASVRYNDVPYTSRVKLSMQTFLPAGTVLKVERIYVRKGVSSYDSVTFRAYDLEPYGDGKTYNVRFWVELADANKIRGEVLDA